MKASSKKEGQIDLFFGNDVKRWSRSLQKGLFHFWKEEAIFWKGSLRSAKSMRRRGVVSLSKSRWRMAPKENRLEAWESIDNVQRRFTNTLWNSFQTKCIFFFFFQVQWTLKWNFLFRSYSFSCFEQVWKVFGVQLAFTESSLSQGIEISKVVTFSLRRRNILAKQ